MKKFVVVLIIGLLLSVDSPAQGFFNSLNKALNGLTQDNQQRNRYSDRQRSSYERRQRTENTKMRDNKESDSKNRDNKAIGEEPPAKMQKEDNTATKEIEPITVPQTNEKVITLVVNGTGETKEEATKNALRSAIEQAFGTFVSANTEVLNDELIKDEITTVSTGNIKSYKELSVSQTSNGLYDASVQATVSIDQLTKFAQSRGMQAELAGASFVMNMKMRELNKKNEVIALQHMIEKAMTIAEKGLFDYKLEIGEPYIVENSKYAVDLQIFYCENTNTRAFYNTIYQTLQALSLSDNEMEEYKKANLDYYSFTMNLNIYGDDNKYYFRNRYRKVYGGDGLDNLLKFLVSYGALRYKIEDNLGNVISIIGKKTNLSNRMRWDVEKEIESFEKKYDCCSIAGITYGCYLNMSKWHPSTQHIVLGGIPNCYNLFLIPNSRLNSIKIKNKGNIIEDYSKKSSGMESFDPSTIDTQYRNGLEKGIYYQGHISLLYTEDELSRLNSIKIDHMK